MKLHRGAQYSDAYRQIAGNVVGEGMTADDIIAAISKHGYLFGSAAPSDYGDQISKASSVAEVTLADPVRSHTFTFSPFSMGFPNVAPMDFLYVVTFNVRVEYVGQMFTPMGVFPPSLTVNLTEGGCVTTISENQFIVDSISQEEVSEPDGQHPHAFYSFTITGETASCGTGDAEFTIEFDHTTWADYETYEWFVAANCIMLRK